MSVNSFGPWQMGKGMVIKLRHPGSGSALSFVTTEDGKLDIGTVARRFGLDAASVKFNGHFVSRGIDFISSVTWKALLSFFDKKGYSTGKNDQDAILVEGVPCSSHSEEPYRVLSTGVWAIDNHSEQFNLQKVEDNGHCTKRRMWLEDLPIVNMLRKRKKLQDDLALIASDLGASSGVSNNLLQDSIPCQDECNNLDLKRRVCQEEFGGVHIVKKHRRLQDDSETFPFDWMKSREQIIQNGGNCINGKCNKDTKKRTRPDDMLVDSPCKRVR